MADNTQAKLQKLLEKHSTYRADFQTTLTQWEKDLKKAVAIKSFGENDIIKKVRDGFTKYIREINSILLYKEDLVTEERNRLLDKRGMYLQFVNLFSSAEITIENLDKEISYELEESPSEEPES